MMPFDKAAALQRQRTISVALLTQHPNWAPRPTPDIDNPATQGVMRDILENAHPIQLDHEAPGAGEICRSESWDYVQDEACFLWEVYYRSFPIGHDYSQDNSVYGATLGVGLVLALLFAWADEDDAQAMKKLRDLHWMTAQPRCPHCHYMIHVEDDRNCVHMRPEGTIPNGEYANDPVNGH